MHESPKFRIHRIDVKIKFKIKDKPKYRTKIQIFKFSNQLISKLSNNKEGFIFFYIFTTNQIQVQKFSNHKNKPTVLSCYRKSTAPCLLPLPLLSFISFILFLFSVSSVFSQNIDIPSLFKPGIRVGALYMPPVTLNDTVKYGMRMLRTTFIIPLNGNLTIDREHFKITAHQSFLSLNAAVRQTDFSPIKSTNNIYNFALSFTHIRASLSNGFWIYHARVGYDNDLKNNNNNNFTTILGGAAKIYVKGLNKINVFGAGLLYTGRYLLPFPVIGLRRKLAEKTILTAVLPIEIDISQTLSDKVKLELKNSIASIKTGFLVDTLNPHLVSYRNDNVVLSNYNLQTALLLQYQANANFAIYAEVGVYPFLRLNLSKSDDKTNIVIYNKYFAPYAALTIRYNIGKFMFGSQMFGTDE